ncbi:MAG: ABC transporter substrate-binding protein [Acetobacterium sp.]|nr:ABC transporter substrate-binding protein [Acetobacterium sp.]
MNPYQAIIDSPDFYKEGCINIMSFPSCPIKVETTAAIKAFVEKYNESHDVKIHYPMADAENPKTYIEALEWVEDSSRYPDIIISCDYRSVFTPNFKKFQEEGLYTDVLKDKQPHSFYETFAYKDPKETYSILAASFPVIVYDKSIDPDLPVPKSFKDLLDPIYEKKVSIHGHGDFSCDMSVVMNIYQQYGKEATLTFAKSIKELRHFSQVVKDAGKGIKSLPPIGVIPEMFKNMIRNKDNVEIIWPADGSPLFPLLMTVKKEKVEPAQALINYLTGSEIGQLWANSYFAAFNAEVKNKDYQDKPVRFIGWDFIYDQDILAFKDSLEEEVIEIIRGCPIDKTKKVKLIC